MLVYCNSGSLLARAGFALRVAGGENGHMLRGAFDEWKAKGGFGVSSRATAHVKYGTLLRTAAPVCTVQRLHAFA